MFEKVYSKFNDLGDLTKLRNPGSSSLRITSHNGDMTKLRHRDPPSLMCNPITQKCNPTVNLSLLRSS